MNDELFDEFMSCEESEEIQERLQKYADKHGLTLRQVFHIAFTEGLAESKAKMWMEEKQK